VIAVRSVLKFSVPYTPFCPAGGYSDRAREPHCGHQPRLDIFTIESRSFSIRVAE